MSRPLRVGAKDKSPAWRGGAVLVGLAGVVNLLVWLLGRWIEVIGLGRITAILVLAGVAMSAPYGRAWIGGRLRPGDGAKRDRVEVVTNAQGPIGTVVVVDGGGAGRRRIRAQEFGVLAYILYTVFWRAPLTVGDYALTGLWNALDWVNRKIGGDQQPYISKGYRNPEDYEAVQTAEIPPPDRRGF